MLGQSVFALPRAGGMPPPDMNAARTAPQDSTQKSDTYRVPIVCKPELSGSENRRGNQGGSSISRASQSFLQNENGTACFRAMYCAMKGVIAINWGGALCGRVRFLSAFTRTM